MQPSDIKDFLRQGIENMGLELQGREQVLERMVIYFRELKKWNSKVNLVARTQDDRQILENHFLDSLSLMSVLEPGNQNNETVMDVGSGAGFPGIVLKAACPSLSALLIEPRSNRFYFLKHIVRTLGLNDAELLNVRLEGTGKMKELSGRKFSFITSRAFADVNRFVRLTISYLAPGGRIVCMKGPGAERELAGLLHEPTSAMFHIAEIIKLQLPFSKAERNLVIIKGCGE